ncbi:relaxase/mobilization nuclease domain-containing protein [Nitrosomonas sp.]|uniref:relaxase/mobilization nuclease domain-containing protein n=1 Tax=Nitrosomonas sp. TaxID=42353 RepID=UPI00374DACFF
MLSFPEGERLSFSDLNAIEERFCDVLGFNGHQRISVIHDDTNNLHMHIAINKIHPRSLSDRKISKRSIEKEFQLCQFETFSVHLNIKPYIC